MAPIVPYIKAKPAQIQLLEKQLTHADSEARRYGAESIAVLKAPKGKPNEPLLEPLMDLISASMEHENWYARQTATQACCRAIRFPGPAEEDLWRRAADIAIEEVAGARMASEDPEVRRCASQALIMIVEDTATGPDWPDGKTCAKNAAEQIKKAMEHEDPAIRLTAVETLQEIGESARPHIEAMALHLADPDLNVRNAVVRALSVLGVIAVGGCPEAGRLLTHRDQKFRRTAKRAVHKLAAHSGKAATAGVASQLGVQDLVAKREVATCMEELGPLCAPHGAALAALLEDADCGIRYCAARALVNTGPALADAKACLPGAPCVEDVFRRISHPESEVRRATVDAMRGLAPICKTFAQAPGQALQQEPSELSAEQYEYRSNLMRCLGGAGANAKPYLGEVAGELGSKDWGVRRAAIECLTDLKEHAGKGAAEVARRLLHQEADVRTAAVCALGHMGIHSGVYADRVEALLDTEEDPDVRKACEEAMARLRASGATVEAHTI